MNIEELEFSGCYKITPNIFQDDRGSFVKTFQSSVLLEKGIAFSFMEEFYSISNKNVFRGMHFQNPPAAHAKLVYCPKGQVVDFLVDLRTSEDTYGKLLSVELNETNGVILYIPIGIAHGFVSIEDNSLMVYKTTYEYSPENDTGINWKSCGIQLDESNLIISNRDRSFVHLAQFESPF